MSTKNTCPYERVELLLRLHMNLVHEFESIHLSMNLIFVCNKVEHQFMNKWNFILQCTNLQTLHFWIRELKKSWTHVRLNVVYICIHIHRYLFVQSTNIFPNVRVASVFLNAKVSKLHGLNISYNFYKQKYTLRTK